MIRGFLILILCALSLPAFADTQIDITSFAKLPVQHEGRIKPVDTLARAYLDNFSGRENVNGMSADAWFAQSLFDPAKSIEQPIFHILRRQDFGLSPKKGNRYNYADVAPALSKKSEQIMRLAQMDPKDWSDDQRALMELHEKSILYVQILRSFSMILPLDMEVPASLSKEWKLDSTSDTTYAAIAPFENQIQTKLQNIIRRKGGNPDKYSDAEKEIAAFAFNVESIRAGGSSNVLFRVIPSSWKDANGSWFSPWAIQESGQGSPESSALQKIWEEAASAYISNDAEKFNDAVAALHKTYEPYVNETKLGAEMIYNSAHPLGLSMFGYLLSFFVFAGASIFSKPVLNRAAFALLGVSAAIHTGAIALRVFILDRPPVGTLYESILFVGAICAIIAIIFEVRRKDGIGILIGCVSSLLLLFTAQGFDGEDTMKVLVAVLNTNFWLATHVLCITAGYGLCVIAAGLAHIHLVREAFVKAKKQSLLPAMKTMGLIALLFTAVGTILGGIWADQSWGRFWGWDPKENGALLIVLWLIWIFHAHLSGHLKQNSFTAAMAALTIIVAVAWFGVNLLNVGLHSYGFINGVAYSLLAFCTIEAAIIFGLWYRIQQRRKG
jgi:ABC-type transport system involved in cytochrome c biogenesis permease subunit